MLTKTFTRRCHALGVRPGVPPAFGAFALKTVDAIEALRVTAALTTLALVRFDTYLIE